MIHLTKNFQTSLLLVAILLCLGACDDNSDSTDTGGGIGLPPPDQPLNGRVTGAGSPLGDYLVRLFASYPGGSAGGSSVELLAEATTSNGGTFQLRAAIPEADDEPGDVVYYILATRGASTLAATFDLPGTRNVEINELTTVATATAFAQFIDGERISGNRYGMYNAVRMAANMADPISGGIARVLDRSPNGEDTSTRRTFYSLANMVAACIESDQHCLELQRRSTPAALPAPESVLQALANITRYPANDTDGLFALSLEASAHSPTLLLPPTSWLLFLKFTGGEYSAYADDNLMSGPGNITFDETGRAWINDNYVPTANFETSCAGLRLMQFHPWGESVEGSPYFGGGLSGAGFGITFDPNGYIWIGNFGFEAPACADPEQVPPDPSRMTPATHDSVSQFGMDGVPVSGEAGFTAGHIWWPQATVSDTQGDIWVANCGNDTVTRIPSMAPEDAVNIPLPGGQGAQGVFQPPQPEHESPLLKPFGIAIDPQERAWVTANLAPNDGAGEVDTDPNDGHGGLYRIGRDGSVEVIDIKDKDGNVVLDWPMGIAGDSQGNMWVSNSDAVNVPCVDPLDPQDGEGASVALFPVDGSPPRRYDGGGISIPWGNAVDGNDTLWVFNFGRKPTLLVDEFDEWGDTGLSHFCGVDTGRCPPGKDTGDAISPPEGYLSDALDRITGGGIDPSGNVWLMNNWKKRGPYGPVYESNPGGNSFVIVPGAAAPIQTPLIGPPRRF